MVNIVEDFIDSPSVELLEQCNHEQLMKIDQHYHVEVEPKRTKENLRSIIQAHLQESGVLMNEGGKGVANISVVGLTFEQQKELLLLQQSDCSTLCIHFTTCIQPISYTKKKKKPWGILSSGLTGIIKTHTITKTMDSM